MTAPLPTLFLAPGSPLLARSGSNASRHWALIALLHEAGLSASPHAQRGLDHGAWVPPQTRPTPLTNRR